MSGHLRLQIPLILLLIISTCAYGQKKKNDPGIRISDRVIERGDTVRISWETKKAKKVEIAGNPETLPLTGHFTFQPQKDTILTFIFSKNKRKEITQRRKIKVYAPQVIRFTVPDSATDEENIELYWNTDNARFVKISGREDSLRTTGRINLRLDTTTAFFVTAHGEFTVDTSEIRTVHVENIESCGVDRNKIYRGEYTELEWQSKLSEGIYINTPDTLYPALGKHRLRPRKDTLYNILVKRRYGKIDTLASVPVKVLDPIIRSFTAKNSILKGEHAQISWEVSGGDSVSLAGIGDQLSRKGAVNVSPDKTTEYVLKVYDGNREITGRHTLTVYPFRRFISSARNIEDLDPGEELTMDILTVDRSAYPDEIILRVVVVDTAGNYVSGLTNGDTIRDGNSLYFRSLNEILGQKGYPCRYIVSEVQEFASSPYDISMVMDYSGSMAFTIKTLELAGRRFINHKYQGDRISLTKFDNAIRTEVPLTESSYPFLRHFGNGLLGYGGYTALYAAADMGMEILDTINTHKVMILFTDGYENSSFQYFEKYAFTANKLAQHIRENNLKLLIVSYGLGTNAELLYELAALADGKFYAIFDQRHIMQVFGEMPRILHQYYELRYKPVNRDGYHKVRLTYNSRLDMDQADYHYYIGDDFDLSVYEYDKDSYWYRELNGKKPVSTPQVVANFAFNKDFIRDESFDNLEKYLTYLIAYPEAELDILAHADNVGTDEQCRILTDRRAERVKKYFTDNGITEERIHTRSFGKTHPVWPGENSDWQAAENRRVELIILE